MTTPALAPEVRERPIIFSAREEAEFQSRVAPEPNSGCWLWTGHINPKGYGRFGAGEMAHRASLRRECIPVPPGMEVDHTCKTRCCVNPDHLEVVTHRENLLRGDTVAARSAAATHCPQGHAYEGRNLVMRGGRRSCRECQRVRALAQYTPTTDRRRRSHLTVEEVADIRDRSANGQGRRQIAKVHGVSITTVRNVQLGRQGGGR